MKRPTLHRCCCLLLLFLGWCSFAHADELASREKVGEDVARLFAAEDFPALEALAKRYWSAQERTAGGVWMSALYFDGLADAMTAQLRTDGAKSVERLIGRVDRWVTAFPKSPMAHDVHAQAFTRIAWYFRGGGVSSTVADGAWKPFRKYVAKARADLEKHQAIASTIPQWYEVMMEVAKIQSWPAKEQEELGRRAVALEPRYYATWFAIIDPLLPKWGGDEAAPAAIDKIVNEAVAKTRSTEGESLYARLYWHVAMSDTRYFLYGFYENTRVSWPRMRKSFQDMLQRYPEPWNASAYAYFACIAADKDATREAFKMAGNTRPPTVWSLEQTYETCKDFPDSKYELPFGKGDGPDR